jgi:hypothetical protein
MAKKAKKTVGVDYVPTMETKDVKRRITSTKTRGTTLRKDIQANGLESMRHAYTHGDITLLTLQYHAIAADSDKTKFKQWVQEYTPFKLLTSTLKDSKGNAVKVKAFKKPKKATGKVWNIVEAEAVPYWTLELEKEEKPLLTEEQARVLLQKYLKTLSKRCDTYAQTWIALEQNAIEQRKSLEG